MGLIEFFYPFQPDEMIYRTSWLDRLTQGFINEMNYFVESILDNKRELRNFAGKVVTTAKTAWAANPVPPREAFEAAKIATALMYSLHHGQPVLFDDNGEPIMS